MAALCIFLENNLPCALIPFCAIIRYSRVSTYSYKIKEGDVKKFKLEFQISLLFTRCKNIWVLILHREHDFLSYFCQSNKYVLINALCIEDSHSFLNSIWKKYMYMWSITYSYMYLKPNYFKKQSSSFIFTSKVIIQVQTGLGK